MSHAEFIDACKNGTRGICVNRSKALQAITDGRLPKKYQSAHMFWSFFWILSILGFIIAAFFTMGISLLGLLFVSPMISGAIKKSAVEFVIEYAVENADFYAFAVANGTITTDE